MITGDLTGYIGHTLTAAEWAALQAECQNRHDGEWTFYADQTPGGYHVRRLVALPEKPNASDGVSDISINQSTEKEFTPMPKVSNLQSYQSPWLKAEDLRGQARRVRVDAAKVETLPQQDGTKQEKIILSFVGKEKRLILNKSQAAAMVAGAGDDTDGWKSVEVVLTPATNNTGSPTINLAVIPVAPPPAPAVSNDNPFGVPDAEIPF